MRPGIGRSSSPNYILLGHIKADQAATAGLQSPDVRIVCSCEAWYRVGRCNLPLPKREKFDGKLQIFTQAAQNGFLLYRVVFGIIGIVMLGSMGIGAYIERF